jgi:hypothetical protein
MKKPAHDAIQHLAYHLWTEEGCPDGRSDDFWLKAEKAMSMSLGSIVLSPPFTNGHPPSRIAAKAATTRQRERARVPAI